MNTAAKIDSSYMKLIHKFPLAPIRNKKEFKAAVQVMKELAYRSSNLTRSEYDYLYVLDELIIKYEKGLNLPEPQVTPVEALEYLMEMSGRTQAELAKIVGHKSNLSAFLHGKRGLSKLNAMRLAEFFKVSPGLFLDKPEPVKVESNKAKLKLKTT